MTKDAHPGAIVGDAEPAFLTAAGHRLEYFRLRPTRPSADRSTLVFLHEGLGCAARWKTFPSRVVDATGHPALVFSRYGYGRSERLAAPRAVDYLHREALEALPDLLAQLGIVDPILVGHSDGASIALIYAGEAKRPVRALVAMAPHVFVEEITIASIAQARVDFDTTDLVQKLGRYHDDPVATFRGWNDVWLHPDFRDWNIESSLADITCPVLLIQGADDPYGTLAQIDAIERQVRGPVQRSILADCGHAPYIDQPDATLDTIVRFLQSEGLRAR
jgi:pimeloyl-ACP methyl ester carboxylesterase